MLWWRQTNAAKAFLRGTLSDNGVPTHFIGIDFVLCRMRLVGTQRIREQIEFATL
jgi:hypothetical protein